MYKTQKIILKNKKLKKEIICLNFRKFRNVIVKAYL
jgi:hypothetical protein